MTLLANHPRREDWIEQRADEILGMWRAAYDVLSANVDDLYAIALSEAAWEADDQLDEAAAERAFNLAEDLV